MGERKYQCLCDPCRAVKNVRKTYVVYNTLKTHKEKHTFGKKRFSEWFAELGKLLLKPPDLHLTKKNFV